MRLHADGPNHQARTNSRYLPQSASAGNGVVHRRTLRLGRSAGNKGNAAGMPAGARAFSTYGRFVMKKFEKEIGTLQGRVVVMGDIAQSMVSMTISAMTDLKPVYQKVLDNEDKLDRMQLEIDHEAVR